MTTEQKSDSRKLHFMNSAISKPGVFSCAIDCFAEICHDIFLPYLYDVPTSGFLELIFNVSQQYDDLIKTCTSSPRGFNIQDLLVCIREPLWSNLRSCCNSLVHMDNNAQFSEIFQKKNFTGAYGEQSNLFISFTLHSVQYPTCQSLLEKNTNICKLYFSFLYGTLWVHLFELAPILG